MKKFMHGISLVLVMSLFINPILAYQTLDKPLSTGVSYKTIEKLLLSGASSPSAPVAPDTTDITETQKKIVLEIPQITERDKIETMCAVLNSTESLTTDNKLMFTLLEDLEASKIIEKIDNTITTFGKTEFAHLFANPESLEALQKHQAFIKELVANEELFNTFESLLQEVKNAEQGIFSFWKEENEATKEYLGKQLFFNKSFLKQFNTNSYALESLIRWENIKTAYRTVLIPYVNTFFFYGMGKSAAFMDKKAQEKGHSLPAGTITSYSLKDAFIVTKDMIKNMINPYHYRKAYHIGKDTFITQGYTEEQAKKYSLIGTGIGLGINGGLVVLQGSITNQALKQANQTRKAINYLHTKLIDVATLVNNCKKLVDITNQNETFAQGWKSQDAVVSIFAPTDTPFNNLIQLLQKKTFKGKASFFSLSGRVLAAHELMKAHKDEFGWLFKAIGEIDAYMSIAKLYKKYQSERVQYNFVNYVTAENPTLHIKGFWHPLIPTENVITNDIALGQDASCQNIILTGSNTAGKSTLLKSILLAALCAQTLTIAPVESITLTYLDMVGSSLHINDDIAAGNSLFKAEVLRAQALVENAKKLEAGQFGLIVIDELFTGTAAEKGAKATYKVAQHLATLPNIIFILATHFPQVTELEKDTQGMCKNYKIDAFKQEDGTIVRSFKLEEGISTTNIANDILQDELSTIDFSK